MLCCEYGEESDEVVQRESRRTGLSSVPPGPTADLLQFQFLVVRYLKSSGYQLRV